MALDKAKTAVLVIDVLVTEGDDTLYNPSPEEERVVTNSVRVVDAARAAGMPVIFCDDAHILGVDQELALWGEHGVKGKAVPNPALKAGTGEKDFIVPKRRYSGFFGTDLDLLLRELGVDVASTVSSAQAAAVKSRLRAETEEARTRGIFGAPTFLCADGEMFWGNDRLEQALAWATGERPAGLL